MPLPRRTRDLGGAGAEGGSVCLVVTPAGLERFFGELTEMNKGLSQPDFARVGELMGSYGMEILGPPLME